MGSTLNGRVRSLVAGDTVNRRVRSLVEADVFLCLQYNTYLGSASVMTVLLAIVL